jgi:hypothetical protein
LPAVCGRVNPVKKYFWLSTRSRPFLLGRAEKERRVQMQSIAINLSVLISNDFFACDSGPLFPHIKKNPSRPPPGENQTAHFNTTAQSESTLLALIFLLIFMHGYYIIFCHSPVFTGVGSAKAGRRCRLIGESNKNKGFWNFA